MAKETRHPFRRRAERPSRRQSGVGARIPSHQLTPSQRLQLEALDALEVSACFRIHAFRRE